MADNSTGAYLREVHLQNGTWTLVIQQGDNFDRFLNDIPGYIKDTLLRIGDKDNYQRAIYLMTEDALKSLKMFCGHQKIVDKKCSICGLPMELAKWQI